MKKKSIFILGLLATLSLGGCQTIKATEEKVDLSKAEIKKTNENSDLMKFLHDNTPLEPTKVFDNLYCIGTRSVVAWALQTEEGIILIDSMWDNRDAKLIEDGMEKLGLNPKDIKYILISHGHGDHYGGAKYLRDKYNAKVLITKTDYDVMHSLNLGPNGPRSPKADIDDFMKDKDIIKLGNTEVTILETPGHTEGCASFIFPVFNEGKEYTAILWGGTGIPNDKNLQQKYKNSVEYFSQMARERGAEVELTAHLFIENGYANLEKVANLKDGEKNPFIIGKDGIEQYLKSLQMDIDKKLNNN